MLTPFSSRLRQVSVQALLLLPLTHYYHYMRQHACTYAAPSPFPVTCTTSPNRHIRTEEADAYEMEMTLNTEDDDEVDKNTADV